MNVASLPGIRVRAENPNHHLWNNHGTWFLHYTVHPTPFTKERIRRSLGTKDIQVARERRDSFFVHLASEANKAPAAAAAQPGRKMVVGVFRADADPEELGEGGHGA